MKPHRRGRIIAVGAAVVVVVVFVAAVVVVKMRSDDSPPPAAGGAPGAGVPANDILLAVGRLKADITAAPADQLDPVAKASLLASTNSAATALSTSALCGAQASLAPMAQTLSAGVAAGAATTGSSANIAAPTASRLDAENLDAQALILTSAGTESCGGAPPEGNAVAKSAGAGLRSADANHAAIHVGFPVPTFGAHEGDGHWYVAMFEPGTTTGASGGIGKPGVPMSGASVAVPLGATPSASTSAVTSYQLVGVPLWPAQDSPVDGPPVSKDATPTPALGTTTPPFAIDAAAYRSSDPYPKEVSGVGAVQSHRGLQLATAWTTAGQYVPATQTLKVITGEDETITFGGANTGSFGSDDLNSPWNVGFSQYWDATIVNAKAVSDHVRPKEKVPELCGEEMMAITTKNFKPFVDDFANRRTAAGVLTAVFTTDTLANGIGPDGRPTGGGIGTTNVAIRDAIAHEVTNPDCRIHPSYVVLFGDTTQIPTFHFDLGEFPEKEVASDLPFGFVNQWSQMHRVENTGVLGGPGEDFVAADLTDFTPDVFVSRMPAESAGEAFAMGHYATAFEDTPPLDPGYYSHVTGGTFFQPCDPLGCPGCPPKAKCDAGTPDTPAPSTQEMVPFLGPSDQVGLDAEVARKGYTRIVNDDSANVNGQTVDPQTYYDGRALPAGADWTGGPDQIAKAVNSGTMLLWHADHGNTDGGGWYQPEYNTGDPSHLSAIAPPAIVWSSDCDSGKFDSPSHRFGVVDGRDDWFGHSWLNTNHAAAYIGSSRESYIFQDGWLLEGMGTSLFPELGNVWRTVLGVPTVQPAATMGALLASAKTDFLARSTNAALSTSDMHISSILLEYNLFGDPSMPIFRSVPRKFVTNSVEAQLSDRQIQIKGTSAMDGAWATVVDGDTVVGRAYFSGGVATVDVSEDLRGHLGLKAVLDSATDLHTTILLSPAAPGSTTSSAAATSSTTLPNGETTTSAVVTSTTPTSVSSSTSTTPPKSTTTASGPPTTAGPLPIVSQLSVTVGGPGRQIYIYGDYYAGATSVQFGSVDAPGFMVLDHGTIVVDVPAMPDGTVDITVTTPNGTSLLSPADRFSISS